MQYKSLIFLLSLLLLGCSEAQQLYDEGVHYQRLAVKQATAEGKVEVMEFFSYSCPHCKDFDPYIQSWKKRQPKHVKFSPVPVAFNASSEPLAQAYYAAEMLGVVDKVHQGLFKGIHEKKKKHGSAEEIADIVAESGVDRKQFLDAMNSFEVDSKVRQAAQMQRAYRITGVPMVAVNGKFVTSISMAGSPNEVLKIIDYLVQIESIPKK